MLKVLCKKQSHFKNFNNSAFKDYFKLNLEKFNTFEFTLKDFKDYCLSLSITLCQARKMYVRANQASFMNKDIREVIMFR